MIYVVTEIMKYKVEELIKGVKGTLEILGRCSRIQKDNLCMASHRDCRELDWTFAFNKAKCAWKKIKFTFDMGSDSVKEGQSKYYYESLYTTIKDWFDKYSWDVLKDKKPGDTFITKEDYDL